MFLLRKLLARGGYCKPDDGEGSQNSGAQEKEPVVPPKVPEGAPAEQAKDEGSQGSKKPSDEEARLLKEVMRKKEELKRSESEHTATKELLKQFEGIDAAAVRKILAEQKTAEETQLEAKGEWDRLKTRMAAEHNVSTQAMSDKIADLESQLGKTQGTINELSIGSLFSQSEFISSELTLTQSKARLIYGDHFDLVDGKVVAYDKPRGEASRTAIVDQYANNVGFDEALRKIVEADPEKDHLIKSKIKPGAGSTTKPAGKIAPLASDADALSKIGAGLKALKIQVNGNSLG